MKLILFTLVMIWCVQAQAAVFEVEVPDWIVEKGIARRSYYREDNQGVSKEQFFIDKCVFDQAVVWILDKLIFVQSRGYIDDWEKSGIKVRVKE